MTLVSPRLREYFAAVKRELKRSRKFRTVVTRAETRMVKDFLAEVRTRGHRFISDEPAEREGHDLGPAALEYFLAGFALCEQAQYAKNASDMGIQIDSLKIKVKGIWDRRGMYFDGHDPYFYEIQYETHIESPEKPETIQQLTNVVEQRCTAYKTLEKASDMNGKLFLNGSELPKS